MNDQDISQARDALSAADRAHDAGIRAGARPIWYPLALGLSVAFALGSFVFPWLTITGVVLGAVILPVAIDMTARRVSGASPLSNSFAAGTRGPVIASIVIVVAVAAGALVLLKTTGAVWGVLAGAGIVGIVTAWCTWWLERRRRAAGRSHDDGFAR